MNLSSANEKIQETHGTDNCIVDRGRGFKPSDRHDPSKKQFLMQLSEQLWQKKNECSNPTKRIDLHKIFTPATDAQEIFPKCRKLYASSDFYSPTLHPTVEDQVELARRISHSLSDISNQQSRGQSMYVNRKKRSVKWVHESTGQDDTENKSDEDEEAIQKGKRNDVSNQKNAPRKFLMNPSGEMRDINNLHETGPEQVNALQVEKGAELIAKRRKVAEKWTVDESNIGAQSPSGLPDYHQFQQQPKICTSPSILPAYTDVAKHRVQLNLHQEQVLEKYIKPGLKVVQTPWEAALTSGSASAAFVEEQHLSSFPKSALTPSQDFDTSQGQIPAPIAHAAPDRKSAVDSEKQIQHEQQFYNGIKSKRELAYKPSIPQGWKAPGMSLPKDLYMPKDIPLQSYAAPPATTVDNAISTFPLVKSYESSQLDASSGEAVLPVAKPYEARNSFPLSSSYHETYSSTQPPKQQYFPPHSYQKVPQNTSQNVVQMNFNPSPLSYDKLAKFENVPPSDEGLCAHSPSSRISHLNAQDSQKRNMSPLLLAGEDNQRFTPSSDGRRCCDNTTSVSPRLCSSAQKYSAYNTSNFSQQKLTSNQFFNAPSYNTSARGWGCGGGGATRASYFQQSKLTTPKAHIGNSSEFPYTDF